MTVTEALEIRRAVPSFDSSVSMEQEELFELMERANLAPSSLNLQPWRFLVCHTTEEKARLQAVSYNQKKISEASAVVVLLGDLLHHEWADRQADSHMERGYLDSSRRDRWISLATTTYGQNAEAARDEMFRGGALWAMAFMLACTEAGWSTAPMGGFERPKLMEEFGLDERYLGVLLVAVGKPNPGVTLLPRNLRYAVADLLVPHR